MLKDIRIHLATDEAQQEQLEHQLSKHIVANHRRSVMAFARNIPSLVPDVQNVTTQNVAIFANKSGDYNIVDYGTGRTVYGLNPQAEIQQQYQLFAQHAAYMSLNSNDMLVADSAINTVTELSELPAYQRHMAYSPLPKDINVMVVFGVGLGYHIEQLVEQHNIRHLIVYEPERQYFQCSVLALNWQRLLQTMEAKGTAVYLQLEKDGRDLLENIDELAQHIDVDGFYFYKHYNHAIFDSVENGLKQKSWSQLKKEGFSFTQHPNPNLYLPIWSESVALNRVTTVDKADQTFIDNLQAFKKYFPNIYNEFKDYTPVDWLPVKNDAGEINLIQKKSLAAFGGDSPKKEALESFAHFKQFPQKDGLVLGYNGTKLKRYKHYQFVEKTESLLQEISEEADKLPDTVKSLIMFGIGLGYQVEELFNQRNVEKLFLCEPNRDFFFASLFAIDWQAILIRADKEDCRIYINIGDDGSHLFRDLLAQFYSIGPYILASTYLYQAYYNAHLVQALAQLREQLQIVISMGEYFDHALYGISHTTETINRGYPLLEANPANKLSQKQKDTPVFLVGNGPSLDNCIEAIKEWQGKAIVVSCGTALMPLYKNGIVPDFHAEIEQNRSTFDWISRIEDFEFLKQVSLISCNGIHPDTCDLFKDVYVAFKSGESSTVSAINILGRNRYEELNYAFPTVSNFALNLFTKIGFTQVYLFGVDLGFADRQKHHSKQSGYYQHNGSEMYDYSKKNNTSLVVPGNFEKTVFTKHEFKVSKDILEQTLASHSIDCFNCSNGAKIKGALPLKPDNILLVNAETDTLSVIDTIKNTVFKAAANAAHYAEKFAGKYREDNLAAELEHLLTLVRQPVESVESVNKLVEKQKNIIFDSYQAGASLLFYILYGSMNYCNVLLSKCEYIRNETVMMEYAGKLLRHWETFLLEVKESALHLQTNLDSSASFGEIRQVVYLKRYKERTLYLTNIPQLSNFNLYNKRYFSHGVIDVKHFDGNSLATLNTDGYTRIRFDVWADNQSEVDTVVSILNASAIAQAKVFWYGHNAVHLDYSALRFPASVVLHPHFVYGQQGLSQVAEGSAAFWVEERMPYVALLYDLNADYSRVLVPKLRVRESLHFEQVMSGYVDQVVSGTSAYAYFLDFGEYLVFADKADLLSDFIDLAGNRAVLCPTSGLTTDTLLHAKISDDVMEIITQGMTSGTLGANYHPVSG